MFSASYMSNLGGVVVSGDGAEQTWASGFVGAALPCFIFMEV